MIQVRNLPLSYYVNMLKEHQPFAFARYGNGEWGCLLGTAKVTGSGSQRLDIEKLRKGIQSSIKSSVGDKYFFLGLQSRGYLANISLLPKIEAAVAKHFPEVKWVEGEVFAKASWKVQLNPMVRELRKQRMVVVGPKWLKALKHRAFQYEQFIEVAPRDCFKTYRQTRNAILRVKTGSVVSFSAGPTSKALIGAVRRARGDELTLIDFGSVWDPYAGKNTRRYHVRIRKNVQDANLAK